MLVKRIVALLVATTTLGCVEDKTTDEARNPIVEPGTPAPLRVGTYNVANLFNDVSDDGGAVYGELGSTLSSDEYQDKLRGLAEVLNALDADILVLQEVEHRAALDDLANHEALERSYEYRAIYDTNDPRGIDIGVLSSVPLGGVVRHTEDTFRRLDSTSDWEYQFARDLLEVRLSIRGVDLTLLAVHLKAKEAQGDDETDEAFAERRNEAEDKRVAEAQHVRRIADRIVSKDPDRGVVILGDMNDTPGSVTVNALIGNPDDCQCDGPRFVSVAEVLPEADRFTYEVGSFAGQQIDDLLLSPFLARALDDESVDIVHDEEVGRVAREASDHAPIAVTLIIGQ